MKFVLLMGVAFLTQLCFAQTMPMVSADKMKVGNHWTWTYYTNGDLKNPYSAERYQIINVEGSYVTFEIRSRYDDRGEFFPNTRFKVNLLKCYQAFLNPDVKVNFMIALYPLTNEKWEKAPIWTQATAFEEKFNCNPIMHSKKNALYETRFDVAEFNGAEEQLFQQWPIFTQSQVRSFYFINRPHLEGVAFRKTFNPGTIHSYEMRLTEWGYTP